MTADPNVVKEDPGVVKEDPGAFDFGAFLKNLEAFGIALGELDLTGVGNAKLNTPFPKFDVKYSGTVDLGRNLAYNVELTDKGLKVDVKAA